MAQLRPIFRPQLLLVLIVILTALRPGDASWVNDEPAMMEMAIRYNHTASGLYGFNLPFTPCPFGLQSIHGVRYGPLVIWMDQLFLALTSSVIVMVAIRGLLFMSLTAVSLNWLAKTLRLSPWFAVITLLSPWVWLYGRSLWDSTWCIPLSALLLAAYAQFLSAPKPGTLLIVAIGCFILPVVHLMSVALVLPVLCHLLIFHRDKVWAWKWRIGLAIPICAYPLWPYLFYFLTHFHPTAPSNQSAVLGWFYPLLGGKFQTLSLGESLPGWQESAAPFLRRWVEIAEWISRIFYIFVWFGMILAVPRAGSAIRDPKEAGVTDHLSLLALAVWLFQTFLGGLGRVHSTPHYYSATWCTYAFLAWMAADWLRIRLSKRVFLSAVAIYAGSMVFGNIVIATTIARNAGTRNINVGTSLGNQIAAIKQLRHYSEDSDVDIQLPQWRSFPLAWKVLLELNLPASNDSRARRHLIVKYRDAYPGDAHIEVDELR